MMIHYFLRDASPEKKRVLSAIFGALLTIGIALLAAQLF